MHPIDYDKPQFLEPAHSHDLLQVSHIISISLAEKSPPSFQDALTVLQESTSVAFASSKRLQALVGERLHRLVPVRAEPTSDPVNEDGSIKCSAFNSSPFNVESADISLLDSEPAFFNYQNHLRAEKRYLLEEALPDWRHKAARVFHEHRQCDVKAVFHGNAGSQLDFETWWTRLQEEVGKWLEDTEDTEIPEFENTVAEHGVLQAEEVKKGLAREERCSRKITLELDVPEPKRERAETMDSGIGMAYNSEAEQ